MDTLYALQGDVMHRNSHHKHVPSEEEVVIQMNGNIHSEQIEIEIKSEYEEDEGEEAPKEQQSSLILDLLSYLIGNDADSDNEVADEFDFGTDDEADPDFIASLTGEFRDKVCVVVEENVFMGLKSPTNWEFEDIEEDMDDDELLALSKSTANASLESEEQGVEQVVPHNENLIDIEPSGGIYIRRDSAIFHYVNLIESMKKGRAETRMARRSDLIYDVDHIMDRNGEYKSIDEKYYWAFKQMAHDSEECVEVMQAALKSLANGNTKMAKENIEQAISTLHILVREKVSDSEEGS
jgi:hypothetical protein